MGDKELQQKMIESQNFISERAIHPDTHLIYGKVDLEDPQWWKNTVFPSPESIRNRFCDDSETPNVSNCAIAGGRFLGCLVDCYDVTGNAECIGDTCLRHRCSAGITLVYMISRYLNSLLDRAINIIAGIPKSGK